VGLACVTNQPERSPVAVGPIGLADDEWRATDQVVLITDASFSMFQRKNFPEAKAVSQGFVRSLPNYDVRAANPGVYQASAIGFGGDSRIEVPLEPLNRPALVYATDELRLLGSPHPRTPLDVVLVEAAIALQGQPGRAAVVVVSDGNPDDPEASIEVAQAIATRSGGACFHTIQTGAEPGGAAFMERLSRVSSCGSSRNASAVSTADSMSGFTRTVMVGTALPDVAAAAPCGATLRIRALHFEFDRADITAEGSEVLSVVVEHLNRCGDVVVRIEGHTDAVGSPGYNEGLSQRRADSVQQYFIGAGVPPHRMATQGYGETQPLASNDSAPGRAENRRVELKPQ
jgi:OOP family OmpA-OmpF porin